MTTITKFDEMIETIINGNISDFRKWLKGLKKADLLSFVSFCEHYEHLTISDIQHHFNS